MPTSEYRSTWATYQAAWEEVSSAERQDLLSKSVTDDCVYSDPTGQATSRSELVNFIEQFRRAMPGASFKNHTFLDHHAQSIATWSLYLPGSEIAGKSWAHFGEDGRITNVSGFFEVPEPAA